MTAKYTTVKAFIADLPAERAAEVNALRKIILKTNPRLDEHIKWNAPSYSLDGEDLITFNMHDKNHTRLVLHAGATRTEDKDAPPAYHDESDMLDWKSDIRAVITFEDLDYIKRNEKQLEEVLGRWLDEFEA